jgi:UDP-N-acetylmuramoyl-L-alanyl-D-glutamate--2,6-diaminopimelate ligase
VTPAPLPPPPTWASSLLSVGVTGTNGKTTTTGMIAALLGGLAKPVGRVTTLGCFLDDEQLDVPPHYAGFLACMERCLAAGGRYAALELTSEALSLGFAKAWPCRVGVFTNLSLDHSDAHGSPEHYLASKAQLFMSLAAGGAAVLNGCDENAALLAELIAPGVEQLRYGSSSRGSEWAPLHLASGEAQLSLEGSRARLLPSARFPDLPDWLELRAIGEIFVENALAALAAALALGAPPALAVARLSEVAPPPGRFQLVRRSPDVVVDYAHTPDALRRTLVTARRLCRGSLTVVFGAGGDRDKSKRPLLGEAARAADHIVLTSDNPRSEAPQRIMDEVAAGIGVHPAISRQVDRGLAIRSAVEAAGADDFVLIAGKGHELTQEIAGERRAFSDVAVVLESRKPAR